MKNTYCFAYLGQHEKGQRQLNSREVLPGGLEVTGDSFLEKALMTYMT